MLKKADGDKNCKKESLEISVAQGTTQKYVSPAYSYCIAFYSIVTKFSIASERVYVQTNDMFRGNGMYLPLKHIARRS